MDRVEGPAIAQAGWVVLTSLRTYELTSLLSSPLSSPFEKEINSEKK